MRRIQNYHIKGRLWDDIGYHFGIGINGSILEGRDIKFQGVHCPSMNYKSIGIVVHGNYNYRRLDFDQIESIIELLVWLCSLFNISKKMNYLKNVVDYKLKKSNKGGK